MDIAEAPLKLSILEYRRRPGRQIGDIGHLLGLVDAMGGGQPDAHALIGRQLLPILGQQGGLDLFERSQQVHARGAQLGFGLGHLHLHHRAVAQRGLLLLWNLALGQADEGIQHCAGEAEGDAGETRGVHEGDGKAIQHAGLRGIGLAFQFESPLVGDEEMIDRIIVAPGRFEPHHMPDVGHLGLFCREKHGAH